MKTRTLIADQAEKEIMDSLADYIESLEGR